MSRFTKLHNKIKNNPQEIRFEEIDSLLKNAGFQKRKGKGSHMIYSHPDLNDIRDYITIPYKKPHIKKIYIKRALEILERLNQDTG